MKGKKTGGRKKGTKGKKTLEKEAQRKVLQQFVFERMRGLLESQVSAAMGVQHFVLRDKTGKFKKVESAEAAVAAMNDPEAVYEFWARDPNTHAAAYLIDQALDKPAQRQEVTGLDGAPVEHVFRWQK
jgi:hypothetical protein